MSNDKSIPPRLSTLDAAAYLLDRYGIPVATETLRKWAWRGGGPAFQKAGQRRLYPVAELDAFAAKRLSPVVKSTSELAAHVA